MTDVGAAHFVHSNPNHEFAEMARQVEDKAISASQQTIEESTSNADAPRLDTQQAYRADMIAARTRAFALTGMTPSQIATANAPLGGLQTDGTRSVRLNVEFMTTSTVPTNGGRP